MTKTHVPLATADTVHRGAFDAAFRPVLTIASGDIETGLRGTLRVTVQKNTGIAQPWAETPLHWITMGFDRSAASRPTSMSPSW